MDKQCGCSDLETFWLTLTREIHRGYTLINALETARSSVPESLSAVVEDLIGQIKAGSCLYEAMQDHPDVFGLHVTRLIEGAERAGILERVLMLILEFAWRCPACIMGKSD